MVEAFHRAHERVFAVRDDTGQVECLNWRGRLTVQLGSTGQSPVTPRAGQHSGAAERSAYFGAGAVVVPLFRGDEPALADGVEGPAIIEEPTTTLVVYPGSTARRTAAGNYVISL